MSDTFITGLAQLKRNINGLTAEMQQKTLRVSIRGAAQIIEAEAEHLSPEDEGGLKAGIVVRKQRDKRKWHVTYVVKVVKAFYWWFVENGTKKMRAQPFLRPAFETKAQEAADYVIDQFNQVLEKWNGKS